MCIINNPKMLKKERAKTGRLKLWKVVQVSNYVGIWYETYSRRKFHSGNNNAVSFLKHDFSDNPQELRQFFGFLSRTLARQYRKFRLQEVNNVKLKIIKVYADRKHIVQAGVDERTGARCISVFKMEIKSLKHQR